MYLRQFKRLCGGCFYVGVILCGIKSVFIRINFQIAHYAVFVLTAVNGKHASAVLQCCVKCGNGCAQGVFVTGGSAVYAPAHKGLGGSCGVYRQCLQA